MEIIITNVGTNKLEAIRAIRQLTSASLKTAKDFAELVEKNYTVAISDIPQDQKNEVMQTLSSAGIGAEISRDTVSIFRKMPFKPSEEQIPVGQPIQLVSHNQSSVLGVRKKTDGSLKGYLKEVAMLECQMWNQERLIQLLNRKVGGLARYREIDKPKKSSYYAKIKEIKKVANCNSKLQ